MIKAQEHGVTKNEIDKDVDAVSQQSFDELRDLLDWVCSEIASKFNLYDPNRQPRKAVIVNAIANSTCVGCLSKKLSNTAPRKRIDGIYMECHRLAVGTLVEELEDKFSKMGYSVLVLSEAELKHGRVDVLIKPTNFGVKVQYGNNELIIEVKTGFSISLSQIFRYMLDLEDEVVILWRIRNRQVLVLDGTLLKPLVMRFMRTCVLRGERLLAIKAPTCEHVDKDNGWLPTQGEIQNMLEDFSKALIETLPRVVKTALETLGVKENDAKS
jgi:hypothetical protein